ncbi:hypothetical protein [Tsukamurella tyrosinosolvens]|uniref:hypothetical protein n=1 Tax=Tsukamurella tyrosinosolvens TaxID=57704 RepID=UPI000798BC0F|nr:hypothetical protein [Tsukamurella tyrosinosolvens]KXO90967.1 hypothetical protein AXK58_21280 [Tsukamurella tyrosinosolvens]
MNTPKILARTAAVCAAAQLLVVLVVASAVPGGASWLTLAGFVTPRYETNTFSGRIVMLPLTNPPVWLSLQNLALIVANALLVAALYGALRTNPWTPGVLKNSTPPKPRPAASSGPGAPPPGPGAQGAPSAPGPDRPDTADRAPRTAPAANPGPDPN